MVNTIAKMIINRYLCLTLLMIGLAHAQQSDTQDFAQSQGEVVELDRVIAVVGKDILTENELNSRIRRVRYELKEKNIPAPPVSLLRKQVLERLILKHLQLTEAYRDGVRIDETTLNTTVENIAKDSGLTVNQFRRLLEREGFDFAQFRKDVHDEILISRIRNRKVQNRVEVSEQEIQYLLENLEKQGGFVDRYHIAHILIAIAETATLKETQHYRDKANEVIDKLNAGSDFRQIAASYSDAQTAMDGGDLGWRRRDEIPSAFAEVVPQMSKGEIAGPIRSVSGLHIIKLLDVDGGDQVIVTQTKVRHIVIKPDAVTNDESVKARLEQLRNRIVSGERFSQVAQANSDDTASAVNGGDLGWVMPDAVVPEFQAVMSKLPVGEISQPFKTAFGWHIILVEDRRQRDETLTHRQKKAREIIFRRKAEEELELWIRRLRSNAYVELRTDESL